MKQSYPSPRIVLAITSDSALLNLGGTPILVRTWAVLEALFPSRPFVIAVSQENESKVRTMLANKAIENEFLVCDPLKPTSLATALEPFLKGAESVLIHDACRPLTRQDQFDAVAAAFHDEIDAVRPALPFTETLKILSQDSIIKETLDRSTVLKISTPELIRVSAIEMDGTDSGWFLPLKKKARTAHIEGAPEGSRINTRADRDLMELH